MDFLPALTLAWLNASQTSKHSDRLNRYRALSNPKSLLTFDVILSVLHNFPHNFNIKVLLCVHSKIYFRYL